MKTNFVLSFGIVWMAVAALHVDPALAGDKGQLNVLLSKTEEQNGIRLQCKVSSDASIQPQLVKWFLDGTELTDKDYYGRWNDETGSQLNTINIPYVLGSEDFEPPAPGFVSEKDTGIYKCSATSRENEIVEEVTEVSGLSNCHKFFSNQHYLQECELNDGKKYTMFYEGDVYKPRVKIETVNHLLGQNRQKLVCKVSADPKPMSIKWFKSGEEVKVDEGHLFKGDTYQSVLVVKNQDISQTRSVYTCKAENQLGVGEKSVELRQGKATTNVLLTCN